VSFCKTTLLQLLFIGILHIFQISVNYDTDFTDNQSTLMNSQKIINSFFRKPGRKSLILKNA